MQVVLEDENERNDSRRVGAVGIDICARRSSRYLERKYDREFESRGIEIQDSRRIFRRNKERI